VHLTPLFDIFLPVYKFEVFLNYGITTFLYHSGYLSGSGCLSFFGYLSGSDPSNSPVSLKLTLVLGLKVVAIYLVLI